MPQLSPNLQLDPTLLLGDAPDRGVLDAQNTLVALIAALPLLDGALVREGFPTDLPSELDRVYVMHRIEDGRRVPANQQGALEETYTIRLLIQSRTYYPHDADGGVSKRRAFAMFNAIDDMIRADRTLDGSVRDSVIETFSSETGVPDASAGGNDGWITEISVGLAAGNII